MAFHTLSRAVTLYYLHVTTATGRPRTAQVQPGLPCEEARLRVASAPASASKRHKHHQSSFGGGGAADWRCHWIKKQSEAARRDADVACQGVHHERERTHAHTHTHGHTVASIHCFVFSREFLSSSPSDKAARCSLSCAPFARVRVCVFNWMKR